MQQSPSSYVLTYLNTYLLLATESFFLRTYLLTYSMQQSPSSYVLTYLNTYLLHATESFLLRIYLLTPCSRVLLLTYLLTCILTYLLTYLLTPCNRALLEKLTGLQLVKKFPAFYGTRRFITALANVRHLSLSWASPIQAIYPHPTFWRSIIILSTHLRLGLPSGLFPSGFFITIRNITFCSIVFLKFLQNELVLFRLNE